MLEALSLLFKKKASFKSSQQFLAYQFLLCEQFGLAIMPTGSGKTALYMSLPFLEKEGCTVVIVPLNGLLAEFKDRLSHYSVPNEVWSPSTTWIKGKLLLVTVNQATEPLFIAFLQEKRTLIQRIVIDEIHQWISFLNYRTDIVKLGYLTNVGISIIGLTATFPPHFHQSKQS
jgi:superfamily II DNA helicase RecQ